MKLFVQKCTTDDIGLTLTFNSKIKFALRGFTWEEFMELVEDLGAKVNKCSYINEYISFFCNVGQDHSIIRFIQMMSFTFGLFTQVSDLGP